jgi:CheY-like chemotaxis protein/HPt (histidine-containing phosphotransfer) domain-containing protein
MSGLLLDSQLSPEQKEFAIAIRNSGEALLTIINDILDFSKIEAGRMELENRPTDIRQSVESALDLLAYRARDKSLELGCMIDAHTPSAVLGDPTRLNQILINLVGNAIKFTEKGEVVVRVDSRRLEDPTADSHGKFEIHFAISDTGIGIPADRMDRLFQAFSQTDSSTSRRYGGTGLGLAISKRLAEMMSGRIWVESEPGKGSTFHFTIAARGATASTEVYQTGRQPALEGKRILVVDDNPTNRQILYHQVKSWGMQPRLAASGEEALASLRRGDPVDVVVTDLHMPVMDGFEFTRIAQDELKLQSLPIMLLSSSSEEVDQPKAKRFQTILLKPIRASRLYNALMQVFQAPDTMAAARASNDGQSPFDPEMGSAHPLRILLAEDNPTNQMLAVAMLDRMGYRADVAGNGLETLEALKRLSYDVVLMDVQMPEMDGLEATREIRRTFPKERQPRIIAMTADAMAEDREACLSAGMDDYLSKPVLPEKLIAALRNSTPLVSTRGGCAPPGAAPCAPLAGSTPDFDPAALQRLRDTLGRQADAMIPQLLKSFETDGERLCRSARTALEQKQAQELRRAAHTLKSTSATFGAMALSQTAREIENLAKNGVWDGVAELIERAQTQFLEAKARLSAFQT